MVPHIAEQLPAIPTELLTDAEDARAAIAAFDAGGGRTVLPYASLLLSSESAASSRIENLTAAARSILLAEVDRSVGGNAAEIASNTTAMRRAIEAADDLGTSSIVALHRALLEQHQPEDTGGWRERQVWIGGTPYGPHHAEFVPPHHEHVPALMDDLLAFMRRDDLPALVQSAVAHAQFESIHPFTDGNGRAGRAIVQALLRQKGVVANLTIPISAGLLTDVDAYFTALGQYRDGDVEPIVRQFLVATFHSLANTRQLVEDLDAVHRRWQARLQARSDATAWDLLRLLVAQPVVSAEIVRRALGVTKPTANHAIGQLERAGVLHQVGGKQRYRYFAAPEILELLDAFSARAGRRQPPR